MTSYWIFDHDDSPQRFPLRQLIAQIRQVVGPTGGQLFLRRSQVSFDELVRLTAESDELFYNLDARWVADKVAFRFGLHDSSALFVDAPPELAKQVTSHFIEVVERSS